MLLAANVVHALVHVVWKDARRADAKIQPYDVATAVLHSHSYTSPVEENCFCARDSDVFDARGACVGLRVGSNPSDCGVPDCEEAERVIKGIRLTMGAEKTGYSVKPAYPAFSPLGGGAARPWSASCIAGHHHVSWLPPTTCTRRLGSQLRNWPVCFFIRQAKKVGVRGAH